MISELAVLAPLIEPLAKSKTVAVVDEITSDVLKMVLLPVKEFCSPIVQRYNATEFLNTNVAPKLEAIPAKNRVEPSVKIFKRVLEGALEVPDEPLLKEMFANLLVRDMNTATKSKVHPKFASILADMSVDEAELLNLFKLRNGIPCIRGLGVFPSGVEGNPEQRDERYFYPDYFFDSEWREEGSKGLNYGQNLPLNQLAQTLIYENLFMPDLDFNVGSTMIATTPIWLLTDEDKSWIEQKKLNPQGFGVNTMTIDNVKYEEVYVGGFYLTHFGMDFRNAVLP